MKNGGKTRILVIRLSALGDVAMTVPVLLALRRTYPEVTVEFVTKNHLTPIPGRVPNVRAFAFHPDGTHKGIPGIWRLARHLKRQHLDGIADLHAVLRTAILKLFLAGTGIPFVSMDKGRADKKRLTSGRQEYFRPLKQTVDRYAEVFAGLGFPVELSPEDLLPAESWPESMEGAWHEKDSFRIGIAPFAAHSGKCYPTASMEEIVSRLGEVPGIRIYLFGGGQRERAVLEAWEKHYAHCISVAGRIPLTEELSLISNLDLMVSMDSGNGHLAAMFGVPVITIWGVTHPYAGFRPFNQPAANSILADREQYPGIPTSIYGNKFPAGYEQAIGSIDPDRIYSRIVEILDVGEAVRQDSGTST